MGNSFNRRTKLNLGITMLRFSTITPLGINNSPTEVFNTHPIIVPPKDCHLREGKIKGNNAYIVGRALKLAGFHLPCFFDGDITELDNPNGMIFMVLPTGTYRIKVRFDSENNYLLDLM